MVSTVTTKHRKLKRGFHGPHQTQKTKNMVSMVTTKHRKLKNVSIVPTKHRKLKKGFHGPHQTQKIKKRFPWSPPNTEN
jgi:hypothetical protein